MKSEAYDNDEDDDEGLMVLLKFTYTDKYPEEKPLLEFEETDNVDEDVLEEFMQYLDEQVRDKFAFSPLSLLSPIVLKNICFKIGESRTEKVVYLAKL